MVVLHSFAEALESLDAGYVLAFVRVGDLML